MTRVIAAPDKFRGTATGPEAAAAIASAVPDCVRIPLADGGEGTLDVFGGPNRTSLVTGPAGEPVEAAWRLAPDGTAVIETALAAGLLLAGGASANDPVRATTAGVGELVRLAIDAGAREVVVGLGGSATTDGGLGAVRALAELAPLDGSRGWTVLATCDVTTAFADAAAVFGPQKGATPAQVDFLTSRLVSLSTSYAKEYGVDVSALPGAGAAGGLAGGLAALGARLVPGAPTIAARLGLPEALAGADLVVTGEGRFDRTSLSGKVVSAVASYAAEAGVPVLLLAGAVEPGLTGADLPGRVDVLSLTDEYGADRALTETAWCLADAVRRYVSDQSSETACS